MNVYKKDVKIDDYKYPLLMHNPSTEMGIPYYIILVVCKQDLFYKGTILYSERGGGSIGRYIDKISILKNFVPYDGQVTLSN